MSHYVSVLQDKGYRYKVHNLPWDADHKQPGKLAVQSQADMLRDCLRDAGLQGHVSVQPKTSSVQRDIDSTRMMFNRFYFNEGTCEQGLEYLGLYHKRYDKKRMVFLKEPVHDFTSHCADALRTMTTSEEFIQDHTPNIKVLIDDNPYGI